MFKRCNIHVLIVIGALLMTATPGAAQWVVTPYAGVVFGGQANDGAKLSFGGSVERTLRGMWSVEADAAWTQDLFALDGITEPLFSDSAISTFMGNIVVASPWTMGGMRVRPFGMAGLGVIRTTIGDEDDDFLRVSNTHAGITLGGGVNVAIGDRFGVRGDVRYLRDLQKLESDSEFFSFADTHVSFWRSTAGLSIRF